MRKVTAVHGIRVGDPVQITAGPYKGKTGIVVDNIKHRQTWKVNVIGLGYREIPHKNLA